MPCPCGSSFTTCCPAATGADTLAHGAYQGPYRRANHPPNLLAHRADSTAHQSANHLTDLEPDATTYRRPDPVSIAAPDEHPYNGTVHRTDSNAHRPSDRRPKRRLDPELWLTRQPQHSIAHPHSSAHHSRYSSANHSRYSSANHCAYAMSYSGAHCGQYLKPYPGVNRLVPWQRAQWTRPAARASYPRCVACNRWVQVWLRVQLPRR